MKSEATSVPSTRLSRLSSSTDVAPIAWSRRARRTHGRTPQRARPRGARPLASPAGGAARPRALTSLTLRSQSRTTSFRNHVCMRPNRYPLVEPRPIKSLSYLLSHSSVGATRVDSSLGYDSTILSRGPCRNNSDASWTWLMMYIQSCLIKYFTQDLTHWPGLCLLPLSATLRVPVCMLLLECQTQTERSESTEHSANKAVSVPSTARKSKSHRPSVCPRASASHPFL